MNNSKTASDNLDSHLEVERRTPGTLTSIRCAECGLRIIDMQEACFTMGYFYHNTCFVCCNCEQTLCGKTFYKDQDKVYCANDYIFCGYQQTFEKCMACGQFISETVLQAMGNYYHPACFTCTICSECLDGVPYTIDADNLVYCLPDYHRAYAPICAACGLAIMPEKNSNETFRVVAMDKEFHLSCYRCIDCKKKLGNDLENRCYPKTGIDVDRVGMKTMQTLLLCLACHSKRIGAVPATTADLPTQGNKINTMSTTFKGLSPTSTTTYRGALRN